MKESTAELDKMVEDATDNYKEESGGCRPGDHRQVQERHDQVLQPFHVQNTCQVQGETHHIEHGRRLLALKGKTASIDKVIKIIDVVVLLKKEQGDDDDDDKHEMYEKQLLKAEDDHMFATTTISNLPTENERPPR